MKKILVLFLSLFLFSQLPLVLLAKSEKSQGADKSLETKGQLNSKKSDEEENEEEEALPGEEAKEKTVAGKLNKIKEATEDPEVEEEVGELAEDQEQVEKVTQQALEEIEDRPAFVKFLIGPDYKNLGQLRSEIVHTRNNIRRLERIQEKATEDEQPLIEAAILELQETASRLQSEIYIKLADFSLFGWLFRWLNGFTPPEEEVTPIPTITGEVTGEPTLTLSPTPTEVPSPTTLQVSPTGGI